mmetsp:Transcript_4012/g.11739  ORF Transcript_4012/g.11739 Transcript_4012/m.11739 type:complete len:297 (+) Transcript_4012:99-989(+)
MDAALEEADAAPRPDLTALMVWILGPFSLDCLDVEVLEGLRKYSEEVERRADEHWQSLLEDKPNLFDGPNWSLVKHEVLGEAQRRLRLTLQRSSYRFMHFDITPLGQALPPSERCNGMSLSSLTETSDGYLVLGLRSRKAGAMPLHWHCLPAGILDCPDPAAVLRKELAEEAAVEWPGVAACELLAMLSSGEEMGHKPEMVFRLLLSVPASDVIARRQAAEDRAEHEALAFVTVPRPGAPKVGGAGEQATESKKDIFFVDLETFVGASLGPLTDLCYRTLLLLRDLGAAPILQLPA